jgi:hypothetical protein
LSLPSFLPRPDPVWTPPTESPPSSWPLSPSHIPGVGCPRVVKMENDYLEGFVRFSLGWWLAKVWSPCPGEIRWAMDTKCPLKAPVCKTWSPMQCSEAGLLEWLADEGSDVVYSWGCNWVGRWWRRLLGIRGGHKRKTGRNHFNPTFQLH